MKDNEGYEGVWRTIRGAKVFIRKGEDLNSAMKRHKTYKENKNGISLKYTPENVNEYFSKIENYNQLEEFRNDYRNEIKFMPYIVPKNHQTRQWVDFINKIDDNNIEFYVLSHDKPYHRKTKSSVKNFVKNYKVHQE